MRASDLGDRGTVMHKTRTPLQAWFWAAYLVATHHPGISAVQLQRQLGIRRYETAWLILHKLRRAMVAPERSLLRGPVEVDEFYVGGIEKGRGQGGNPAPPRRSWGSRSSSAGKAPGACDSASSPTSRTSLCAASSRRPSTGATIHTDAWQGYRRLSRLGYDHRPASQRQAEPGEWLLPRAHRSISNLKAWLHGTHRDVSREHLQVYLDEFVFRHNRRRTPMAAFQTLLGLGAERPPPTARSPPGRLTILTEPTGYAGGPLSGFRRSSCVRHAAYDVRMADIPHGSSSVLASGKREDINRIAAAHGARNVRVFGSVGRGEANGSSDLDLLVDMSEGRSLLDLVALGDDLEDALGVVVDVVTEKSLPTCGTESWPRRSRSEGRTGLPASYS